MKQICIRDILYFLNINGLQVKPGPWTQLRTSEVDDLEEKWDEFWKDWRILND